MGTMRSLSSGNNQVSGDKLALTDLAEVLFVSTLQESDNPSVGQVRAAVAETLQACGGDCAACAACVAQEAGDHPEQYVRRMRWALRTVESAYTREHLLAA